MSIATSAAKATWRLGRLAIGYIGKRVRGAPQAALAFGVKHKAAIASVGRWAAGTAGGIAAITLAEALMADDPAGKDALISQLTAAGIDVNAPLDEATAEKMLELLRSRLGASSGSGWDLDGDGDIDGSDISEAQAMIRQAATMGASLTGLSVPDYVMRCACDALILSSEDTMVIQAFQGIPGVDIAHLRRSMANVSRAKLLAALRGS